MTLICGRYEGFDERIVTQLTDEQLSIGDFVLAGGELAAAVVIEAVARLIPGVLGCGLSATDESFSRGRLEYPQWTRPPDWNGESVPAVLLSGDHGAVDAGAAARRCDGRSSAAPTWSQAHPVTDRGAAPAGEEDEASERSPVGRA